MAADVSRARIAVLGCGAVGTAFAGDLVCRERRYGRVPFRGRLALWSRSPASVRRCRKILAELSRGSKASVESSSRLEAAVEGADVVLVCVADDAQAEIAVASGRAAAEQGARPVVLLSSGYQALEPVRARLDRRISLGRLHPLAPVQRWADDNAVTFQSDPFGIEGDPRARRAARALLRHWHGKALELRPGRSAAYHAGASLAGGGCVALFALAEELMAPAVRSRRELREALEWFIKENARNVLLFGPLRALTGPLARGSEATVRGHLRALGRRPRVRAAYVALGEAMIDFARERGSLDAASQRRLRKLLRSGGRAH